MKRKRHTEEQIIAILKEHEAGVKTADLCRNSPIRSFCSANTCSTRERIFDFALLARRIVSGIARPFGFLRWMWLRKPFLFRNVSLAADR